MLEAVKKRFDAAGIEIPYAYQNLVIKEMPEQGDDDHNDGAEPVSSS